MARQVDFAMTDKSGFDYAFALCRINLGIIGLWPNLTNSKVKEASSLIFFTVSIFIIIVFVNVAQTAKLIMIWGDLSYVIRNLSTANMPIAVVVFKMFICLRYKKVLAKLLRIAMNDWSAVKTPRESENMLKSARTTRKISLICVILGAATVNGQLFVRIFQELDILPGPEERRLPMLSSCLPYEYKASPVYEITWLMQYAGSTLATFGYSGVYCVFVGLVLHLRGQVANLSCNLQNIVIFEDSSNSDYFRRKLGSLVERHESLNRFAEDIETLFTLMFLAEIISCTIHICLQVFLLVTILPSSNESIIILEMLFLIVFVTHVGTHIFICCYVTDKLHDESLSVCDSVYNYEWYKLPARDAKLFIFIMLRAKKPLVVTAGKFCALSFRLFAQILKTSVGYLSMLLAVRERSINS